ncbi:MAG: xylan 1,4-beta-xylosidase [Clostridiales bacterium]|nr:xylan 1,4-beta-xylosidase [Clostridiales bacterium]
MKVIATNPILPGFYPDPSICAVSGDYYLVNSTFAYFPGLPIFHSKDLVHWEQIGNAMDRKSQLPLKGVGLSHGLFAPTIRYHDGVFYIICTNITGGGNFIITATNPEGPWSDPYYLGAEQAPGIDPSLFFDEDGTCYYIGTRENPYGARYYGDNYVWIQKLDLATMKLVGEPFFVWNGALRDVVWPEGPHLYKKDGYYYILYAEGGTGSHHSVCVIRSKNIEGPYENNFCNPIITHRFLGKKYPVQYVGHADMIQAIDGAWYMVMLAVRPKDGFTNLGRETFLAKVDWEDGWPVINPGIGLLTDEVEVGLEEWNPLVDPASYSNRKQVPYTVPADNKIYDFAAMAEKELGLGLEFLQLREPSDHMYQFVKEEKALRLYLNTDNLLEQGNTAYLGIRQSHHAFEACATARFCTLKECEAAGLVLMQNNQYHVRLEVKDGMLQLIQTADGRQTVHATEKVSNETITLIIKGEDENAAFFYTEEGGETKCLAKGIDISTLSTEVAGGFVGCTLGMYGSSEGRETDSYVDFLKFSYQACK